MQQKSRTIINCRLISTKKNIILSASAYIIVCIWLFLVKEGQTNIVVCPSKLIYHIPCPGCGVTRATLLFLEGNFWDAVSLNPNCLFAIAFILIYPVLVVLSLIRQHSYIDDCYRFLNKVISRKLNLLLLILFEVGIWIHNIVGHI